MHGGKHEAAHTTKTHQLCQRGRTGEHVAGSVPSPEVICLSSRPASPRLVLDAAIRPQLTGGTWNVFVGRTRATARSLAQEADFLIARQTTLASVVRRTSAGSVRWGRPCLPRYTIYPSSRDSFMTRYARPTGVAALSSTSARKPASLPDGFVKIRAAAKYSATGS